MQRDDAPPSCDQLPSSLSPSPHLLTSRGARAAAAAVPAVTLLYFILPSFSRPFAHLLTRLSSSCNRMMHLPLAINCPLTSYLALRQPPICSPLDQAEQLQQRQQNDPHYLATALLSVTSCPPAHLLSPSSSVSRPLVVALLHFTLTSVCPPYCSPLDQAEQKRQQNDAPLSCNQLPSSLLPRPRSAAHSLTS